VYFQLRDVKLICFVEYLFYYLSVVHLLLISSDSYLIESLIFNIALSVIYVKLQYNIEYLMRLRQHVQQERHI
jgi:DMSO/TMAO reductase YedYZ heme-binding membrane subunit